MSDNTELAITDVENNDLAPASAPMSLASTIAGNSNVDKARVFNATSGAISLNAAAKDPDFTIDVVDIFQTVGIRKSRNPMLPDMPCVNTYLLTIDGDTYMSQSDGIARSARDLVSDSMFPDCGKSTEAGCIRLGVKTKVLENGNTVKSLVIVG